MTKLKTLFAVGTSAAFVGAANAADYTAEIATASTEGNANVSAATVAVIAIAVIGFGVGAVVAWMRR